MSLCNTIAGPGPGGCITSAPMMAACFAAHLRHQFWSGQFWVAVRACRCRHRGAHLAPPILTLHTSPTPPSVQRTVTSALSKTRTRSPPSPSARGPATQTALSPCPPMTPGHKVFATRCRDQVKTLAGGEEPSLYSEHEPLPFLELHKPVRCRVFISLCCSSAHAVSRCVSALPLTERVVHRRPSTLLPTSWCASSTA